MIPPVVLRASLTGMLAVGWTTLSLAQTGLEGAQAVGHDVSSSLQVVQGYNKDVPEAVVPGEVVESKYHGYSTLFHANGRYSWSGPRVQFGSSGSAAARYLRNTDRLQRVSHSAGVGLTLRPWRSGSVIINQSATYSPTYLYGLLPALEEVGLGGGPETSWDFDDYSATSYQTTATLTQTITARSTVSMTADLQSADFDQGQEGDVGLRTHGLRGMFSHALTRRTDWSAEYHFRDGGHRYAIAPGSAGGPEPQDVGEHGVEFGVRHRHPVSRSRQLIAELGVGASRLELPGGGIAEAGKEVHQVTGRATIGFTLTRTWSVRGAFRRGTTYVPTLIEPVLQSSVSVSLAGAIAPRVNLTLGAAHLNGQPGVTTDPFRIENTTGNASVGWQVSGPLAVQFQYLYHRYASDRSALNSLLAPARLRRNALRVGVSLRVPAPRR